MNEERYWAFIGRWKAHEARNRRADRDQLTGLVRHEISDHLLVFTAPGLEVRKVAGAVIIGQCFGDVPGLGTTPVGPAGIAERNWGNFVAIDAERERASRWVLRAPLGHLEPHGNLLAAARYLRQMIDKFGTIHLALAAYNAGPGRVEAARGIPHNQETPQYVRTVLSNWKRFASQYSAMNEVGE